MRRYVTYLFVALLTFVVGISASMLLKTLRLWPAPAAAGVSNVNPRSSTPVLNDGEPASEPCGCSQSNDKLSEISKHGKVFSGGILNGKAVSLPRPAYPPIAMAAHASGSVPVQIVVDETGCVISSKATGGHPLLQAAAVQAACRARFTPTRVSGEPVKVSGVIMYNFLLQ
ncbi:MAG TPA: TonB family protein [Pyrinomonadaceae bacterium]